MRNLLVRHGKFLGTGTLQGKLYDLGRYPGAVLSNSTADRVFGETYEIDQADHVFALLDDYEGRRFKRHELTVILDNGRTIQCWTYIFTGSVAKKIFISSGDYLQYRNL